jgi:hypothetical protein
MPTGAPSVFQGERKNRGCFRVRASGRLQRHTTGGSGRDTGSTRRTVARRREPGDWLVDPLCHVALSQADQTIANREQFPHPLADLLAEAVS